MLAVTHAVTGAIIARTVTHPILALTLAAITHPLLDLFPHWDFNTRWAKRSKFRIFLISAADSGLGFLLGFSLFFQNTDPIILMASMLMAQWPDFLEAPYHFGFNFPPFSTIKKLQHLWHTKLEFPWGFYPQVAIITAAILLSYFG